MPAGSLCGPCLGRCSLSLSEQAAADGVPRGVSHQARAAVCRTGLPWLAGYATILALHAAPILLQVKYYQYPALTLVLQAPVCLLLKVTEPPGESWSQVQASCTSTTPGLVVWRPRPETSPAGSNLIHTCAPQDVKGAADIEDLRKKLQGSEAALQAQQASMQAVQEVQTCSTLNPSPVPAILVPLPPCLQPGHLCLSASAYVEDLVFTADQACTVARRALQHAACTPCSGPGGRPAGVTCTSPSQGRVLSCRERVHATVPCSTAGSMS